MHCFVPTVNTNQEINPQILGSVDSYYNKPGVNTLHEVIESYEGGKISQISGVSASPATIVDGQDPNSVYSREHSAVPKQTGGIYYRGIDQCCS